VTNILGDLRFIEKILNLTPVSMAQSLRSKPDMERRTDALNGRRLSQWRQAIGNTAFPTHDEIAARAHAIYLRRGGTLGSDLNDWLQAERELLFTRTLESQKLTST
jgi:hypothetical protein